MTAYVSFQRQAGFTLIELTVALVLSLLTGLAVTSAVTVAVDAATSYQTRQLETNAGLALTTMFKNDLKKVGLNGNIGAVAGGDIFKSEYINANGEVTAICYRIVSDRLMRSEGTCGSSEVDVTPVVPSNMAITVTCDDPCTITKDANGDDALVSGLPERMYAIIGLRINIDSRDRMSAQFDDDGYTYLVPEIEFPIVVYEAGQTDDATVDAAALAYVDPDDLGGGGGGGGGHDPDDLGGGGGGGGGGCPDPMNIACLGGGGH